MADVKIKAEIAFVANGVIVKRGDVTSVAEHEVKALVASGKAVIVKAEEKKQSEKKGE